MKSFFASLLTILCLAGCSSAYYGTMEKLGIDKREILVDRVKDARDSQQDAQEQFRSALEEFQALVDIDGGELEDQYENLREEFEDSQEAAEEIRDQIDSLEDVSTALFREWEDELSQYTSDMLRRDSEQQLKITRLRHGELINKMRSAEARLQPVLDSMGDQVLFLKHNLNAQAIRSLRGEFTLIDRDIDALIRAMEQAINEADAFIADMTLEG